MKLLRVVDIKKDRRSFLTSIFFLIGFYFVILASGAALEALVFEPYFGLTGGDTPMFNAMYWTAVGIYFGMCLERSRR